MRGVEACESALMCHRLRATSESIGDHSFSHQTTRAVSSEIIKQTNRQRAQVTVPSI